ncbi:MAG: TetR/AcrR family transcriptional regulator [Lachnospiraceae bacterium]|nr:TetR/AcrR family transcriptional regulator [Lachnospiraceae bacterium]
MEDLRKKKSREMLKKAFLTLLEEKPYDQITITDVAKQSQLNRKTFYSNYEEMDDLLKDCLNDFLIEMLKPFFLVNPTLPSPKTSADIPYGFLECVRDYTYFILANQDFLRLILKRRLDGFVLSVWKDSLLSPEKQARSFFPRDYRPDVTWDAANRDLYYNYSIHSHWGNLIWILDHADLPAETLISRSLTVYQTYLSIYLALYPKHGEK